MLSRLRIADLALVEDLEIDFGPGLNVLTGETGAGKSVIVESIGLLTGGRASASVVREGAGHATVEGLFLDADGEEWVVRREVWRGTHTPSGQSATGTVMHFFRITDGKIVDEWSEGWGWIERLGDSPAAA